MVFTFQETGEWVAVLFAILNAFSDHKKSVRERASSNGRRKRPHPYEYTIPFPLYNLLL